MSWYLLRSQKFWPRGWPLKSYHSPGLDHPANFGYSTLCHVGVCRGPKIGGGVMRRPLIFLFGAAVAGKTCKFSRGVTLPNLVAVRQTAWTYVGSIPKFWERWASTPSYWGTGCDGKRMGCHVTFLSPWTPAGFFPVEGKWWAEARNPDAGWGSWGGAVIPSPTS